ncbi:DUF4912 domain-containing protein [Anaerobacillus sp. CMMVII]|uniref:DUF4912 domain-containing protein n=1 Tax=Anaerobacillus sp. CMMVII TaxID=2755588 RepID=UPI0021B715D5|nr:DUF4912 domain-containing protein [Anaerobacillus sp. CMMVII]MCT8139726.1 DUF4912 domain-containing protein [Anaerobacillus sp. CMMVII]
MISEILKYQNIGLSIREIASELNLSISTVQYQINKHQQQLEDYCAYSYQKERTDSQANKEDLPFSGWTQSNQCGLMVQSPHSLFCYWEFSNGKKRSVQLHLNQEWSTLEKKIRLFDITSMTFNGHNAHQFQEYTLPEECRQWFFYHVNPNRTYCVDIGVIVKNGGFFSILRSNSIGTPRAPQNDIVEGELNWVEARSDKPKWIEGFSSYSYYEK